MQKTSKIAEAQVVVERKQYIAPVVANLGVAARKTLGPPAGESTEEFSPEAHQWI